MHNETKVHGNSAPRTPTLNYESSTYLPSHTAPLSTSTEDHNSTNPTPSYTTPNITNSSHSDYSLTTPVTNNHDPSPSPNATNNGNETNQTTTDRIPDAPTTKNKESREYETSLTGIRVIDQGEKDNEGQVLEAGHERCDECGGMVVWATKGEYLMICEKCGEPQ